MGEEADDDQVPEVVEAGGQEDQVAFEEASVEASVEASAAASEVEAVAVARDQQASEGKLDNCRVATEEVEVTAEHSAYVLEASYSEASYPEASCWRTRQADPSVGNQEPCP